MSIHNSIRSRRKQLGLTQEQLASRLCVSVTAVSKWETGQTCPDTSMLVPLARHLHTDINALFEFRLTLTDGELTEFCRLLLETEKKDGIRAAFCLAEKTFSDYPQDLRLHHAATILLDSLLKMSEISSEQKSILRQTILNWYHQLCVSEDAQIRNSAHYMLANLYMDADDFDAAQSVIDRIADKDEMQTMIADKTFLQIKLYQSKGEYDAAIELIQRSLSQTLERVHLLLNHLTFAALGCNDLPVAESASICSETIANLCGQGAEKFCGAKLALAQRTHNVPMGIEALDALLGSIVDPYLVADTPLFSRLQTVPSKLNKHLRRNVLQQLQEDPSLEYLRGSSEYAELIERYREHLSES